MKRKILFAVMFIFMLTASLMLFPDMALNRFCFEASAAETFNEGIYTYTVVDGEAAITKITTSSEDKDLVIPETLGGYPVTSLEDVVFSSTVRSVTFPESVESIRIRGTGIGALTIIPMKIVIENKDCSLNTSMIEWPLLVYAPQNSYFENLERYHYITYVPLEKVKTDGNFEYLIENDKATLLWASTETVGDIVIPSDFEGKPLEKIGAYAFSKLDITSVKIPDSVISIEEQAFYRCNMLSEVSLPENLKTIGKSAFTSCDFSEIYIPESVETIDTGAFVNIKSLNTLEFASWKCTIGEIFGTYASTQNIVIIGYNGSTAQKFAEENNITFEAFEKEIIKSNSDFIYSINSDNTITIMGAAPDFSGELIIPSHIDGIPVVEIKDLAFMDNNDLTSVVIAEGIKKIGTRAFMRCRSLTSLVLPSSLETMGDQAFWFNDKLTGELVIPGNLKEIPYGAFSFTGITSLKICDGVEKIGESAFDACDYISEVNFPESVNEIAHMAFAFCPMLRKVIINNKNCDIYSDETTLNSPVFSGAVIYGYENSTAQAHAQKFSANFVILEKEISDAESIFKYTIRNNEITITGSNIDVSGELIIPSKISNMNVVAIGDVAFADNRDITSVVISDGVKYIGSQAFYNCTAIQSVSLPETMETIFNAAFENCSSLEEINFPKKISKIGVRAFNGCDRLSSVKLYNSDCVLLEDPSDVTVMDRFTFSDNTLIYANEYSTAHEYALSCQKQFISFESIYAEAFTVEFSDGILTVTKTDTAHKLADLQFYPWSQYKDRTNALYLVDFGSVPEGAFDGFEKLTAVVFDGRYTTIVNGAFTDCNSLRMVVAFAEMNVYRDAFESNNIKYFSDSKNLFNAYKGSVKFTCTDNTVTFNGDVTLSSYDFFDLVAVICSKYDNIDIIKFDKFTATDFKFYYFNEDDWSFEECKDNTLEEAEFTVQLNVEGEMKPVSFNTLCEKVADGETLFTLVAKDKTQTEIKDTDIEIKEEENFFDKALAWITSLINKLLSIFTRFGK